MRRGLESVETCGKVTRILRMKVERSGAGKHGGENHNRESENERVRASLHIGQSIPGRFRAGAIKIGGAGSGGGKRIARDKGGTTSEGVLAERDSVQGGNARVYPESSRRVG